MKEKKVMKLASRGKRFGAFCIDAVVPVIATMIFFGAFISVLISEFMFNPGFGYGNPGFGYGYGYGYGYGRPSTGAITAFIISIIMSIAYLVVQLVFFNKSKTIGKAALGLQVISSNDGEPIGFWKMLFREWFVKAASGSVFALGFIWVLIDDKNRGWHDKILDTYVVDLKESAALNYGSQTRPAPVQQPVYRPEPEVMHAPAPKSAPIPDRMPEPAPKSAPIPDRMPEHVTEEVIDLKPVQEPVTAPAVITEAPAADQVVSEPVTVVEPASGSVIAAEPAAVEPASEPVIAAAPVTVEDLVVVEDNLAAVRNDVIDAAAAVTNAAKGAIEKVIEENEE